MPRGGKRAVVSAEERAAIVAAYRRLGRIRDVLGEPGVHHGGEVVRRVLHEEGVVSGAGQSPLTPHREEVREALRSLWEAGASRHELNSALAPWGIRSAKPSTIEEIMQGVPRGKRTHGRGRQSSGISISENPEDRIWLAGVFDARGTPHRASGTGGPSIRIGTGDDEAFAHEIARIVGGGRATRKESGGAYYQLFRTNAVVAFLEAIEPFLRAKGALARRMIADMKEEG